MRKLRVLAPLLLLLLSACAARISDNVDGGCGPATRDALHLRVAAASHPGARL